MLSPQGEVRLGTVPWNPDYKHIYEPGLQDTANVLSFLNQTTTNYTYIREDSNIRVPYNADDLYGINYCGYVNNGKWFFCFVTTITFVSNNTTLLHLVEDIWMTWGPSISWRACLVGREHVNTDGYGEWRTPEPSINLEQSILSEDRFNDLSFDTIVIGTNAIPHLKSGVSGTIFTSHGEDDFDGNDAVAGGWYHKLYSGLRYYAFTRSDASELSNFLDNLNKAGAAESVACMFMVPSSLITIGSGHVVSSYGTTYPDKTVGAFTVSALGYSPRNKKCLTFPYCYMTITDYNGGQLQVKYEDCNTWGDVVMQFSQGLDPSAVLYCTLKNHQGQTLDYQNTLALSQNPQCAWVYSAYMNWLAQNSQTIKDKQSFNVFGIVGGLGVMMLGTALFATGAGAPAGGALGTLGLTTAEAAGLTMFGSGLMSTVGSTKAELSRLDEIEAQSKVPNHISGQSSSNSLQGIDRNMGGYVRMGLTRESAERLDNFFDVFGYQIDRVKVPNITGRPSWNYVKTVGANMGGAIPADRLATINTCLDNGVTFWHTSDIGNYGLGNGVA